MSASPKQRAFLAAYEECGCVVRSAAAAGIDRSLHYQALNADPEYVAEFQEAEKRWADTIEGKARRWAQEGIEEPVYHQGIQCGTRIKVPQSLVIKMLEGAKPDRYRTNHHIEGHLSYSGITALTDAELDRIARGGGGGAAAPADSEEQDTDVLPG